MSFFKEQLQSLPSVAGIVHTAMVLRDELIKDLAFGSFTEVMAPKVKGTNSALNQVPMLFLLFKIAQYLYFF